MIVTLSFEGRLRAALVGLLRYLEAKTAGLRDAFGLKPDDDDEWKGLAFHIWGAAAELAVAIHLGIPWSGSINTFRTQRDVGRDEVRYRSKPDYQLMIRVTDPDDARFWLVRGDLVEGLVIVGWIYAGDAKQHPEWIKTYGGRPPAWFVPDEALVPA